MNSLASDHLPLKIFGKEPNRLPLPLLGTGGTFPLVRARFPLVDMIAGFWVNSGCWISRGAGVKICPDMATALRVQVITGVWGSGVKGCLLLRVVTAEIPTKRNSSWTGVWVYEMYVLGCCIEAN